MATDFATSALARSLVAVVKDQLLRANSNAVSDYQTAFSAWIKQKEAASPIAVEPEPPSLAVIDETQALSIVMSGVFASTYGFDFRPAISHVQVARLQETVKPPAPPPQVGPQYEANKWALVPGDTSPIGTKLGDFVKTGTETPWGWFGAHWEKV